MHTKLAVLLILVSALSSTASPSRPAPSVDLRLTLQTQVHGYSVQGVNFADALTHVASKFQIPLGLVWANTPAANSQVNLAWKETTVQKIIESVAKTQPGYGVEVANGVVHVFPQTWIADPNNFLMLKIEAFDVHNVPVELAARQLRDSVKRRISPPKQQPGRGGIAGSGFSNADDPRISVQMSNVTVEQILDKFVTLSGRKIWIVTFSDDASLTPTGFRRTLSLWNRAPLPDDEQPVWDMFRWGDALPRVAPQAEAFHAKEQTLVQDAFSEVSRGLYTSWSEKYLARLGDSTHWSIRQDAQASGISRSTTHLRERGDKANEGGGTHH